MHRRTLIKLAGGLLMSTTAPLQVRAEAYRRVRPGEAGWPTDAQWKELDGQIGGRLIAVPRPLEACRAPPQERRVRRASSAASRTPGRSATARR